MDYSEELSKIPQERYRKLSILNQDSKENHLIKEISDFSHSLIDLCSNDYFGLSRNNDIQSFAFQIMKDQGFGSGGSRFITGTRPIHSMLEEELSYWLKRKKVLLFPSGFQANIAAIRVLANKNSIIIADKLIHNSLIVGVKASGAKLIRYSHNDLNKLRDILKNHHSSNANNLVVITESLFSMEGTIAPIKKIAQLCNEYKARLLVDEAHAIGILGDSGRGLSYGIKNGISIISGTFGKAFGGGGAYLACDNYIGEYIIQKSGEFRYTTALAPPLAAGALKALSLIKKNPEWSENLISESRYWKKRLSEETKYFVKGDAHILSIITKDANLALNLQYKLERKGILCIAIRPPTVPQGESRLRITLRKNISKTFLNQLIKILNE